MKRQHSAAEEQKTSDAENKKPGRAGFFKVQDQLLDLAFLVDHMLTNNGIKFLDFHLPWHSAFVFGGGVEVTRASSRFQFNFVAHDIEPLTQC